MFMYVKESIKMLVLPVVFKAIKVKVRSGTNIKKVNETEAEEEQGDVLSGEKKYHIYIIKTHTCTFTGVLKLLIYLHYLGFSLL